MSAERPGRPVRFASGLVICVLIGCFLPGAGAEPGRDSPARPRFADSGVVIADEGHAVLRWELPEDVEAAAAGLEFELEQARDPGFGDPRLHHRGPEQVLFVSGLADGQTYFRVRAVADGSAAGPWSDAAVVEVDYPGRGQVVVLLLIGCSVFAATVAAIVAGWARNRAGA